MGSAVLEGGRSAGIHEFFFQAAKRSDKECVELQVCLFADYQKMHFQVSKRSDKAVTSRKRVDLLMFKYSVFRVRNFEICAVLSCN